VFHFFPAIFNLADAYITTGLLLLLFFYWRPLSVFVSSFEGNGRVPETVAEKDGK
jgi:hypothetical protein